MIMCGYEWKGQYPFKDVYFTGMVRDKKRRKMSKSLGNSPDALKLIADYGADGVRYGMLSCSPAGGDLLFDDSLVDNGRKFSNKIWNATSYIVNLDTDASLDYPAANAVAARWVDEQLSVILEKVQKSFSEYRLSKALMTQYSFFWNDVFNGYMEIIKPATGAACDEKTKAHAVGLFEKMAVMLHPFMPFITEEIWHRLRDRTDGEDCMVATYPKPKASTDKGVLRQVGLAYEIITAVRDLRNKHQLSPVNDKVDLQAIKDDEMADCFAMEGWTDIVKKMANVTEFDLVESGSEADGSSFICGKSKFVALMDLKIDVAAALAKAQEDLAYEEGFIAKVRKKLGNERFVSNAPEQVVAMERKKEADSEARIKGLQQEIEKLKGMA